MNSSKSAPAMPARLWVAIGALLLGAAAMAAFYFYDLPIAQAVYRPDTVFGTVLDAAAPTVPPLIALFLLLATAQSGVSRPAALAEWGFAAIAAWIAVHECNKYGALGWPWFVQGIAAALLLGLGAVAARRCRPDPVALRRLTVCAIGMILLTLGLTELLKNLWGRQRFCTLPNTDAFTDWLTRNGAPASDAFKSFPSGHTANVGSILLLTLFPYAFPALRRHRIALGVLAGAVILLTAFSRMVEGMHYASDVTAGAMIAIVCWILSERWLNHIRKRTAPAQQT